MTPVLQTKHKDSYIFNEPNNQMSIYIMNGMLINYKGMVGKAKAKKGTSLQNIQAVFEGFIKWLMKGMNAQLEITITMIDCNAKLAYKMFLEF